MPVNISFKWTSSSQVSAHDSGGRSTKLPEINPGVHTVSACMHPCPQESHRTEGPMGVNPWQQARASVLNSREKSSMVGECRRTEKGFLEVLQCRLCQRPDYTCVFPCLQVWQWAVLFHYFTSVSLPKRAGSSWRRGLGLSCLFSLSMSHSVSSHSAKWTGGEGNGTYRHHQRASLHEKSMSWTGMGK